jgi:hypothetical protein
VRRLSARSASHVDGAQQPVPAGGRDAAAARAVDHALRVLAAGIRKASRTFPPVYAVLLEADQVRLRLAAVDDDPPEPWKADDRALVWSAHKSILESTSVDEAVDVHQRRLVTLGVDGAAAVFLDLVQADGIIGLSGERRPLHQLAAAWIAELADQVLPGTGRVLLVGVDPPAALVSSGGAVAPVATVAEAIAVARQGASAASVSPEDQAPDAGAAGTAVPAATQAWSGVLVLASAPDQHELTELQALTCQAGAGWAVLVLGGCEAARWNLTLQRNGQLNTGTLGLMGSAEEPAAATPNPGQVRPSGDIFAAARTDRQGGREADTPPSRWPVVTSATVAAVAIVALVVAVSPRTLLRFGSSSTTAAHATTSVNPSQTPGGPPVRSGTSAPAAPGGSGAASAAAAPTAAGSAPGAASAAPGAGGAHALTTAPAAGGGATTAAATGPTGPIVGGDGKCIGLMSGKTASGTPIDVYSCVGDATQKWIIATDGTIRNSGMCLDVANGSTSLDSSESFDPS